MPPFGTSATFGWPKCMLIHHMSILLTTTIIGVAIQRHLANCAGRSTPCNSRYRSKASSSLQFTSSSHVVSPKLQQTLNSRPPLFHQCPSSSSTNHSWSSSAPKLYSLGCTLLGNSTSLDALYGLSSDTWKIKLIWHSWSAVGSSSLYVDVSGHAFTTLHGPMNFGQSFLSHPLEDSSSL